MKTEVQHPAEDSAPKTPLPRIVVRDIHVSDSIYTENPAQLLIHPPELPALRR